MVLNCTICGNREAVSSGGEDQEGHVIKSRVKSLLKLMKIHDYGDESFQFLSQEISNTDWDWSRLFCLFCNSRNEEIHNLICYIEDMRRDIERDFAFSEKRNEVDSENLSTSNDENDCDVDETVRLTSVNLRRLLVQNINPTMKWTTTSTQTDEDDEVLQQIKLNSQQSESSRLRPRSKASVLKDDLSQNDNEEDGCFEPPAMDYTESDSDFSVDKVVKKRKSRKGKKQVKSKRKSSTATDSKLRTKIPKVEKEESTESDHRLRRQYNSVIKDVVVQLEKLPSEYLSTSRVTRGKKNKRLIPEDDSNPRLSCRYEGCKRTFTNEEERDAHTKKKHEGITHPFSCPECPRTFRQQKLCLTHIKSHSGILPFVCEICQKGFVNRSALKSHAVRHTTETPFKCDICSKGYKGYGGLVYHKRKMHSGIHPYQCERCGTSFVKSDKLKRHIASVHATDKPIICEICGKTFSIRNYLYMHMRIHQGNPFVNKNRKKSVIASSSSLEGTEILSHPSSSTDPVHVIETEFVHDDDLEQDKITVGSLDSTLEPPSLGIVSTEEEQDEEYPQISTISHGSQQSTRQIILTLDTKSSNISHHRIQTDNPNTSNSTFVINFNKKALSANPIINHSKFINNRTHFSNDRLSVTYSSGDSVGEVVHEPQNLLLTTTTTTGGREGNVTNNSPSSSIHRVETFRFPPLTALGNQIIQASQQGVIQYFPLTSIPDQFTNGFEIFSNQNNANT